MFELWGYKVCDKTCKAIGEFTIAWSVFEAYFFETNFNTNNSKMIQVVLSCENNSNLVNAADKLYKLLKNDHINFKKDADVEKSLIDRLHIRSIEPHFEEHIENFLNNNCKDNAEKVLASIFIANRLRNNLLHGIKDYTILDSQIEIFKVLKEFLCLLISDNAISVKNN